MSEEKKWTMNIGADFKKGELSPELKLKDKIDENSDFEIKFSKDKIYAEYELRF